MESISIARRIAALAVTTGATVAASAAAGCAIDSNTDEPSAGEPASAGPATGQTQQAESSFGIWSWGCSSTCALDLGSASGQTCFLAGVWGNLQPAGSYSEALVEQAPNAQGAMTWGIEIITSGRPLGATAVCVPGSSVSTGTWHAGQAEVNLGSVRGGRRCFLSGVQNISGGFTSASDFAQVHVSGTSWMLGGSLAAGANTTAYAICITAPSAANDFGLVAGEGSSFLNEPVQSNNPGGWVCGLKKLGGHFTANNYNDGVWFDYNNGSSNGGNPQWELNAVNGKQTTTDCVN